MPLRWPNVRDEVTHANAAQPDSKPDQQINISCVMKVHHTAEFANLIVTALIFEDPRKELPKISAVTTRCATAER